jgi:hypothetical protein
MFSLLLTFLLIFGWLVIPEFTLFGIPLFAYLVFFNRPSIATIIRYKAIIAILFLYLFLMFWASIFGSNLGLFYRIFLVNIVGLIFTFSILSLNSSRLGIILLIILILECVVVIGQYYEVSGFWVLPDLLARFLGITQKDKLIFTFEEIQRARGLHVLVHKAGPTLLFLFLACYSIYRHNRWFIRIVVPLTIYSFFCLQSRSVVFASIIGIVYYHLFRKRINIRAIFFMLLGVVIFLFMADSLDLGRFIGDNVGRSDIYRFQSYQYALDNFVSNPWFGHSFDSPLTVHSVLLRILAEFGILVGVVYLVFHLVLWWSSKTISSPHIFRSIIIITFLNAQAHSSGLLFYDFIELPALLLIYKNLS